MPGPATPPTRGRPRDPAIDRGILDAALTELATKGFAGFSLASVADAAGTTRPALYRRWATKEALVIDAIAHLAAVDPPATAGEPFADLVTELEHFRHCITDAAALPLAGLMLGDGLDDEVRAHYLEVVVAPRRARLRALIDAAVAAGDLPRDADIAVAGSFLTGSWYAMALAGVPAPDDWAERVARLVWRACGGTPPSRFPAVPTSG